MAAAKPTGDLDPLVQAILNETKPGEDEHAQRTRRYDKSYEIYRATQPLPANLEEYRSKLRPQYALSQIDTAMVNIAQGTPRCKVLPRKPPFVDSSRRFQLAMDYFVAEDDLTGKIAVITQQALVYGVTVAKTHWLYKTGVATRGVTDPMTGQKAAHTEEIVLRDGPSLEPWDAYDAWWEPNARSADNAEWVALRTWASKFYMEQNRCTVTGTHEWYECDGLYHNLDALYQTGAGRRPNMSAQDTLLGGPKNLKKDRFEVVEYWRDNRLTVVGNKQVLLRDMPNPHWHGEKPVCVATTRPDMFKMQGIPLTELLDDFQQALWMIENIRQENIHLTTWRAFTLRQSADTTASDIVIKPRAIIPVVDHDDLKAIEIPPLPPEAYEEEQVLLQRMQDTSGISPYISGAAQGTVNQNTATGVSILNSAASRLLQFMAAQVQNGIYQRAFRHWGADVQQFLERDVYVRIVGPGGAPDFATVTPQDVEGEYDFILEGSEESLSKAQERQDAATLLNMFMPAILNGLVSPKPIYEKVARAFGFENPEELFVAPQAQPPAAPHPPQNGAGYPGSQLPQAGPGQTLMHGLPLPGPAQQAVLAGGQ